MWPVMASGRRRAHATADDSAYAQIVSLTASSRIDGSGRASIGR